MVPDVGVQGAPGTTRRCTQVVALALRDGKFKTPTLVIHGELDYRVPYGQGLQLFTALQLQKVPSKLLVYPDEGHWILKPQNTLLWYNTFIDWVGRVDHEEIDTTHASILPLAACSCGAKRHRNGGGLRS